MTAYLHIDRYAFSQLLGKPRVHQSTQALSSVRLGCHIERGLELLFPFTLLAKPEVTLVLKVPIRSFGCPWRSL